MSVRQVIADAGPVALWRRLAEFGETWLRQGGAECVTGDPGDLAACCIRSVVQLDGDIVTDVRLVGPTDVRSAAVLAHRRDLDRLLRRAHRDIVHAQRVIVGTAAVGPPVLISAVGTTTLPLLGMVGAGVVTGIRRLAVAIQIVALVALLAASALLVGTTSALDVGWMVWVWAIGVGLPLVAAGAAVPARWWIRRRVGLR